MDCVIEFNTHSTWKCQ